MKCLSLMQPWATLLISGHKKIETRSYRTHHRGRLLIHASKTFRPDQIQLCESEPFRTCLRNAGHPHWSSLPQGVVIGWVELVDCISTTLALDLIKADLKSTPELPSPLSHINYADWEVRFGNYDDGRWAWLTKDPLPLVQPIEFKAFPGIFNVPDELVLNLCPWALPAHVGNDSPVQ